MVRTNPQVLQIMRNAATADSVPRVSVVMSTYNDHDSVGEAIESIRCQTFQNWEFIVINDGSTDGTQKVLEHYAAVDFRIRLIHQENTGLTAALIKGCSESKADLIARQDADDKSMPERLEQQLAILESDPSVGFVSCFADYVGPSGEFLTRVTRPIDSGEATRKLLEERVGPPAHGTIMFRSSIYEQVGGYRPEFYYGQDADLWLRMGEVSKISYVPKVLYCFQFHASSITGSRRSTQKQFGVFGQRCRQARLSGESEVPILREAKELSSRLVMSRSATQSVDRSDQVSMSYLIGSQLLRNRNGRGCAYLWEVIRCCPWHFKAWVLLLLWYVSSLLRRQVASKPHELGTSVPTERHALNEKGSGSCRYPVGTEKRGR